MVESDLVGDDDDGYRDLLQALDEAEGDPALNTERSGPDPAPSSALKPGPGFDQTGFIDVALSQLRSSLMAQFEHSHESVVRSYNEKLVDTTSQHQAAMELAASRIRQLQELAAKLQLCYDRAESRDQHRLQTMTALALKSYAVVIVSRGFHRWIGAMRHRQHLQFLQKRHSIPAHRRSLKRTYLRTWRAALLRNQKQKREEMFKSQLELVSTKLITTYEANLQTVRAELTEARRQIAFLIQNKGRMEREMKQAFLRSVSALNLEAMSMFSSKIDEAPPRDDDVRPLAQAEVPSASANNTPDLP